MDWYGKAEAELGVSADVEDQNISISTFRMAISTRCRAIPELAHRSGDQKCAENLKASQNGIPGNGEAARPKSRVRNVAGGAQFAAIQRPARLRRQHQLHSDLSDPGEIRSDDYPE